MSGGGPVDGPVDGKGGGPGGGPAGLEAVEARGEVVAAVLEGVAVAPPPALLLVNTHLPARDKNQLQL